MYRLHNFNTSHSISSSYPQMMTPPSNRPAIPSLFSFSFNNDSLNSEVALSRNYLWSHPNFSERNRPLSNSRNSRHSVNTFHESLLDPQTRFSPPSSYSRSLNLQTSQPTQGIRTTHQHQTHPTLLDTHDLFSCPTSFYDLPIHIHHRTPTNILQCLIEEMQQVHIFTIGTQFDPPSRRYPQPIPSLIHIQAIHTKEFSTIMLIEIQHLPDRSTPTFSMYLDYSI